MQEILLDKPGELYGGSSLYIALTTYPKFRGLSLFGFETRIALYIDDSATQLEIQAILDAAIAHIPAPVDQGPWHNITLEQVYQWIDNHVGGITDLTSAKVVLVQAFKAIARRLIQG